MPIPLNDYQEKREQSEALFARDQGQKTAETTPAAISSAAVELAQELSAEAPRFIPVVADAYGLYGWCSDGVEEKIRCDGGAIRYGWTIWEHPRLFLTAEFHAVWASPDGALMDITPKPMGETQILFAPDPSYLPGFDFDLRPLNRRRRLYAPPSLDVNAKIKALSGSQLAYEEKRAARAGLPLAEWLQSKVPPDNLALAIDAFLAAADAFDVKSDTFQSTLFLPDVEYIQLNRHKAAQLARMIAAAREKGL